MPISAATTAADAGRYVNEKLIERSGLTVILPQFFEKRPLPKGNGRTAFFIRYNRSEIPVNVLTEGTPPNETLFTITEQSVAVDQWGLFFSLTDVTLLTTKHPVFNETLKLLADAVSRVENFIAAESLVFSTTRQFWDGTRANRAALTATDFLNAAVLNRARSVMLDAGAPTRAGELYVAVMGPNVQADVLAESAGANITNFATLQAYGGGIEKVEKGTVGIWLGFKIVRTNLIPKFTRTTITPTVASTATAGSLTASTAFFYKFVQKNLQRGFSENIAVEATFSTAAAQNTLRFTAPAAPATGVVYDLYFGSATGDSNLRLAFSNILPAGIVDVSALPGIAQPTAPATPPVGVVVHPVYIFAAEAADEVPLEGSNMQGMVTPATPSFSDPLVQQRRMGAKWMTRRAIRDQTRVMTIEVASRF